ncbi:MAG: glycosyltransferase family 1 protein [Bacteriovoracaceae bacterium]|nr:glycosyltransferase family 4 protein [Bacteroidota bacterium]
MKILYDYQIFSLLKFGGISRYFAELVTGINNDKQFSSVLGVRQSMNVNYQKIIRKNNSYSLPGTAEMFVRKSIGKLLPNTKEPVRNKKASIDLLRAGDYDIFHPTYYDPYFMEYCSGKPYVVTVYDMIHELFPEYFSSPMREELIEQKKVLINNAAHVIAISEQTKKDILSIHSIDPDRITSIHLSSSFGRAEEIRSAEYKLPERYILFVGTRDIYKNFTFFLESMKNILLSEVNLFLICAGPPFTEFENHLISTHGLSRQVMQRFPDDDELKAIYKKALCLVYPTKYEGFGLPILEAFACGCPVVTSTTASLPEVGGDAVLYCSPTNADEIQQTVHQLIGDSELRKTLRRKGYDRLTLFSWEKTVQQTKAVYTKVLSQR